MAGFEGQRRARTMLAAAAAVIGLLGGACSGSSAASRPTTPAGLQILAPAPNAETGPDVHVQMSLSKAHVVPGTQTGGQLRSDRGHIHLSVDGTLIAMPYSLGQTVTALTPGPHTIQAEFVAVDHQPFANRVVAAVTFSVR